MRPSLSIIGCGFIGNSFLNHHADDFSDIFTLSRDSKKHPKATVHIHCDIYSNPTLNIHTDFCLIFLPFSRQLKDPTQYTNAIKRIINQLPKNTKLLFTSSTSIYPNLDQLVTEETPPDTTARARALLATEALVKNTNANSCILRLGGICGQDRNSYKRIQTGIIQNAHWPVNLIHVHDIIGFIMHLIQMGMPNDTINVCCTEHPNKQDYYTHCCHKNQWKLPTFIRTTNPYKIVSNQKMTHTYQYTLKYTSPLLF